MFRVLVGGGVDVVYELLLHLPAEEVEHLVNVLVRFGAALQVLDPIGFGEVSGLLKRDLAVSCQILLISD